MKHKFINSLVVILTVLTLTFGSLGATPAKAAGPGAGWLYQRAITLSAGTPSANFQIRVQLVGAAQHANMNAVDGRDLRFYDATDTQASYWIETWNPAGTSTIWVEVPTAGTTTLTLYYGNAAATAVSNGDNTFIAFDDFSGVAVNVAKWSVYDPNSSIVVSAGSVTVRGGDQLISTTPFVASDGVIVETVLSSNVTFQGGTRGSISGASSLSGSATFFTADEPINSRFAVWSHGRDGVYGINLIQDGDLLDNGNTGYFLYPPGWGGAGTWVASGGVVGTAFETGLVSYFFNYGAVTSLNTSAPGGTLYPLINNGLLTNINFDPFSITTFRVRKFVNTYNPTVTVGAAVSLTNSCTSNVAEVGSYSMVYQLSIPVNSDYNAGLPAYSVNNAASIGSFNRVGYCLQLDGNWVWVSMNAFTAVPGRIGVPVASTGATFQQTVSNMNVASNVPGVVTGTGIATGNIEFWHNCYTRATVLPIGGNNGTYDFNDDPGGQAASCYGSMQVHNYGASQTIFAWNAWDVGNNDDLGIGNSPVGAEPDWTFRYNAGSYATRTLTVYVANDTTAPTVTSATSTTANGSYNVPDAINITVNFSESISSAAGLAITLDTGAVINTGALTNVSSYSGTYTVAAGETSSDLTVSSITGTITDAATNITTNPTIPAGQNIADSKAIVIDTTAPTVTSATSTTTDGSYNVPDAINITVNFSESITSAGLTINLDSGGSVTTGALTNVTSYSGTYTVGAGQNSADLTVTSITGTITDAATNNTVNPAVPTGQNIADSKAIVIDTANPVTTASPAGGLYSVAQSVTLACSDVGGTGCASTLYCLGAACAPATSYAGAININTSDVLRFYSTDNAGNSESVQTEIYTIDASLPTVTSATSTTIDGTYTVGATINITLNFSENITSTGLTITLDNGAVITTGTLTNVTSYSGTYTVAVGQNSTDLTVSSITGTITDAALNNTVNPAVPAGQNIADSKAIVIDTTAPSLTSFTRQNPATSSTNADTLVFRATFSVDVQNVDVTDFTVNGTTTATITGVNVVTANSVYEVTVSGGDLASFNGTVGLDLAVGQNITDLVGNPLPTVEPATDETYLINNIAPIVVSTDLAANYTASGPGNFTVTFNKDVDDPAGNTGTDDVTNPANYLLVNKGVNGIADTSSCGPVPGAGGVKPDDTQLMVSGVTYDNVTFTATVTLPGSLPVGSYRLFVCGTTSIVDAAGNPLNGGTDYTFDFVVSAAPTLLPATGFPQGRVTSLPAQPASKAYASTDMVLEIPSLDQKMTIVGVPQSEKSWDVTWLGNNAGWLNGSAYPTWAGNTVLTGHVWDSFNRPGPFANLKNLKYGDQFYIHAYGMTYTYEVRENKTYWAKTAVSKVFQHEELDWVTLMTCEAYNPLNGDYFFRRAVRAVLISVK